MADFDIEFCPHCGEEINYTANTCSTHFIQLVRDFVKFLHDFLLLSKTFPIFAKRKERLSNQ